MGRYRVRVGDDGKAVCVTDNLDVALCAAIDLSLTSALHQAYVRDTSKSQNVAYYRNGEPVWIDAQ